MYFILPSWEKQWLYEDTIVGILIFQVTNMQDMFMLQNKLKCKDPEAMDDLRWLADTVQYSVARRY